MTLRCKRAVQFDWLALNEFTVICLALPEMEL
jgi:hypothetical protein